MMPAKDPSAGVVEAVEGMVLRRFRRVAPTLRAAFAGFRVARREAPWRRR